MALFYKLRRLCDNFQAFENETWILAFYTALKSLNRSEGSVNFKQLKRCKLTLKNVGL